MNSEDACIVVPFQSFRSPETSHWPLSINPQFVQLFSGIGIQGRGRLGQLFQNRYAALDKVVALFCRSGMGTPGHFPYRRDQFFWSQLFKRTVSRRVCEGGGQQKEEKNFSHESSSMPRSFRWLMASSWIFRALAS